MAARRLPAISGKDALRALRRAGFELRNVRGSHHVLTHPGPPRRMVSIPIHGNRTLATGTLASIIEESGLSLDKFISLL